jgi:ubiquinone/menaquinone biosynthesis C-methylase UbiE
MFGIYWNIQRILVPGLKYSQEIYEEVLKGCLDGDTIWLDLGCGHQVLPEWRLDEEKAIVRKCKFTVGVDYDLRSLKMHKTFRNRIKSDITALPFRTGTFNLVTANRVLEHFTDPMASFKEIARMLGHGGIFLFHTPNIWGYTTIISKCIPDLLKKKIVYFLDGRTEEDIFPARYKANSINRIMVIAEKCNFSMESCKMIVSSPQAAVIPPLAIVELVWIRMLMTRRLRHFRTNMIAKLIKK